MSEKTKWAATFEKDRNLVASDGTRIAYTVRRPETEKHSTPVLFVNGWTCPDDYWRRIGPAVMDAGRPVIYMDVRGHGDSGLPRPPGFAARNLRGEDVSAERLARDVVEVVEAAGFERSALAGHSMGVQAIVEAARVAPERVAALIPIAGTFENPVRTFANLALLDRLYPVAELLFKVLPLERLSSTPSPELGAKVVKAIRVSAVDVQAADVAAHMAHVGHVNFAVLFRMMSELRRHQAADFLPQIAVPTLVLAGRKDLFTPPGVQQKMADTIPDCEIVWFEEGGHLLPVEEPDGIIAAINEFLARRVTDRRGRPARPPSQGRA